MLKSAVVLAAFAGLAFAANYEIDPAHSSAQFTVRHMMISNVHGAFSAMKGTVAYDPKDLAASKMEAIIDVNSIDTREAKRDAHLKSPDFFDAAKYPRIVFRSTKFERGADGRMKVLGDLTMHGVTKPVTLLIDGPSAEVPGIGGKTRMGASAAATINRSDLGLTWNKALETGGVVVGDEVKITLDVEMVKQ